MVTILEILTAIVAVGIYGTVEKPRHPIWRNTLRTIAFSGSIFVSYHMFRFNEWPDVHMTVSVAWAFGLFIVFSAEYDCGRPWLSLAAAIAGILLFLQVLKMEGVI